MRFVYNRGKAAVTEERLERIGYLEPWIFEYESRDIFSEDVWHTRQALMKWHIKVPKANSRWYVEYVQLVKTDVEFHCSRTLRIGAWHIGDRNKMYYKHFQCIFFKEQFRILIHITMLFNSYYMCKLTVLDGIPSRIRGMSGCTVIQIFFIIINLEIISTVSKYHHNLIGINWYPLLYILAPIRIPPCLKVMLTIWV